MDMITNQMLINNLNEIIRLIELEQVRNPNEAMYYAPLYADAKRHLADLLRDTIPVPTAQRMRV